MRILVLFDPPSLARNFNNKAQIALKMKRLPGLIFPNRFPTRTDT